MHCIQLSFSTIMSDFDCLTRIVAHELLLKITVLERYPQSLKTNTRNVTICIFFCKTSKLNGNYKTTLFNFYN